MKKSKKPTHRQYQTMIAHCDIKGSIVCSKIFQPIIEIAYPDCCSNCKIAFDFKNKDNQKEKDKMNKENKKKEEFEKLPTSELLNIEIDTLGDFELDAYFEVIYNREPFDTLTDSIHNLEHDVEELKRLLRSHKHTSDGKAVTDIDI